MSKILFVENEQSLQELYYEELSEAGYEVILAGNGQEALKKFEEESPDLVVMDRRPPGMGEIALLNALLAINRQALVIINTASFQNQDNFLTCGVKAYIIKSSDLTKLKQKIREVLKEDREVAYG